jgi:hypothetical protein
MGKFNGEFGPGRQTYPAPPVAFGVVIDQGPVWVKLGRTQRE